LNFFQLNEMAIWV